MITFIPVLKNFWITNNWRKDLNFVIQFGTSLTFFVCMVLSRSIEFSKECKFSRLGLFQQWTVENLLLKYLYRWNTPRPPAFLSGQNVWLLIDLFPTLLGLGIVQCSLAGNVLCKVHCSLANALWRIWTELAEDVSLALLIAHM